MEMNKVIVGQKHGWTIIDWIIRQGHIAWRSSGIS
jgi:hypothetical protein